MNLLNNCHFEFHLFQKSLLKYFDHFRKERPWRVLFYRAGDPYYIWVSEVMLQQTVIRTVIPKYIAFVKKFPDVKSLAREKPEEIFKYTAGLGYYRRFRFMVEASKIIDKTGFPQDISGLKKLPGVGSYTAAAVGSICFGIAEPVIDGNVERILCRIFHLDIASNDLMLKKAAYPLLKNVISKDRPGDFNQALMEIGQEICRPGEPRCLDCPLNPFCLAFKKGDQKTIPRKKIKPKMVPIHTITPVYYRKKKEEIVFYLSYRKKTYKFLKNIPGFPINAHSDPFQKMKHPAQSAGIVFHTITHHKIQNTVSLIRVTFREKTDLPQNHFFSCSESDLKNTLTTSFDKKIMEKAIEHLKNL